MATYGWGNRHSVMEWLVEEAYRFDFYQAVKLLEMNAPKAHSVGAGVEPHKEAVQFKSVVSLEFPISPVNELRIPDGANQAEMHVNFMGIAGVAGPLPLPYTEHIIERSFHRDTALQDFLDIFNHRLISLMYRIYKKYRIAFDPIPPEKEHFAQYFYSLIGMGTPFLRDRMRVPDRIMLRYAGIFSKQPRSMSGLEYFLSDFFGIKVRVEPFCGQWDTLEDDQQTAVGASGKNQILGESVVLGKKIWNQFGRFRLCLEHLSLESYQEFLPSGDKFGPLLALARHYAGLEYDFDVKLSLNSENVAESRLGSNIRLGWNSWMKTQEQSKAAELIIAPRTLANLFLIVIWHNDYVIDEALEKIPFSMVTSSR